MGKAAREARRELEAQAQVATDLNILKTRPYLVQRMDVNAIEMMTPMGKVPGCRVTFTMQNDTQHEPIILDPMAALNLIALVTSALTGAVPAPDPTVPAPPGSGQAQNQEPDPAEAGLDNITPSGLIIP